MVELQPAITCFGFSRAFVAYLYLLERRDLDLSFEQIRAVNKLYI